ncbi:hypothetical protein BLOT_013764 [Blomia tropicalis]|nr:hypothetical protein BLOT_013764 [Blomia tropicalis]
MKLVIGSVLVSFCIVNQQNNVKQIQKYNTQTMKNCSKMVYLNIDILSLVNQYHQSLFCVYQISIAFELYRLYSKSYIVHRLTTTDVAIIKLDWFDTNLKRQTFQIYNVSY